MPFAVLSLALFSLPSLFSFQRNDMLNGREYELQQKEAAIKAREDAVAAKEVQSLIDWLGFGRIGLFT